MDPWQLVRGGLINFDRFWPKSPIFADFGEIMYGKGRGGKVVGAQKDRDRRSKE